MSTLGPVRLDPKWLLATFDGQMLQVSCIVVLIECGLLFPLLPGDTLLFSMGLFIARAEAGQAGVEVNLVVACGLLTLAAFTGSVSGYEIGRASDARLYRRDGRFVKRRYIDDTRSFFDELGSSALVLGRLIPIIRTLVTLAAGLTRMDRRRFLVWSFVGAVLWASGVTVPGYFLGSIPFQKNIEATLILIVAISLVPAVVEWVGRRRSPVAGRG